LARPSNGVDVGTVLKAAQAVSGEIVLGELIKTLLRIALSNMPARACGPASGPTRHELCGRTTGGGQVKVTLRETAASRPSFPNPFSITMIRTRESVILMTHCAERVLADEYICQKRPGRALRDPGEAGQS